MLRCWTIQKHLTTWIDGELPQRQADRVRRHLRTCAACAAEADRLRVVVDWQRRALPGIVTVDEIDTSRLRFRLQASLAAEANPPSTTWRPRFHPLAVAGAAAMVGVILVMLAVIGGPNAILIPLGVESPPVALTRESDLFENYQLIQHLDALENFDTVETAPLDDNQPSHRG